MKPLTFQRKKENLDFLLQTIRYFFNTGEKPKFDSNILKDQSFFSLIKNTYTLGYVYEVFKNDSKFIDSWLYDELKRYIIFYQNKEDRNNRMINSLKKIITKHEVDIVFLKDYNYKTLDGYVPITRFSNDIDILIRQKDIFYFDDILTSNEFGLRFINFDLSYKPHLDIDENINFTHYTKKKMPLSQKQQLRSDIKSRFRHFTYAHFNNNDIDGLLEVHFHPNNYYLSNNNTYIIKKIWENTYLDTKSNLKKIKPEARIIYDADHFMSHFRYTEIHNNGFNAFLGHLERVCDLAYNITLEKEIDWNKLNNMAKDLEIETELFFYLSLGKEYLNLPIPENILKSLKNRSNLIKRLIFNFVDINKLFQDKQDLTAYVYSKLFPKRKF